MCPENDEDTLVFVLPTTTTTPLGTNKPPASGLLQPADDFQLVFGGTFDHRGILCFDVIPE